MSTKKSSIARFFKVQRKETATRNIELEQTASWPINSGDNSIELEQDNSQVERKSINKDTDRTLSENAVLKEVIATPNQPSNFQFPKINFGKQSHSLQASWFKEHPWLHYNEESDSAFCYICVNQNM